MKQFIKTTIRDFLEQKETKGLREAFDTKSTFKRNVYGYDEESGPRCMTYLPWRDETGRWASHQFSLRGDPRTIICYPEGTRHYGQHINWATIKNMNHMAPISNPEFQNKLHSLRNPDSAH